MMAVHFHPQPKPELRARTKRRQKRLAAKVVKAVRAQCVTRDDYCRCHWLAHGVGDWIGPGVDLCRGPSEWAHLGEQKRFKTRGQPATVRHTTAGSLILCRRHHHDYDQGRLIIDGDDANGRLDFRMRRS